MTKRANKQSKRRIFRRAFKKSDILQIGAARPYRFRQGDGLNQSKLPRFEIAA